MKKQILFYLTFTCFSLLLLSNSAIAQWNTGTNVMWTNNNVEIRGDWSFMQDDQQVIRIGKGSHASEFRTVFAGAEAGANTEAQTAFGYQAGRVNTGINQSAFGHRAGRQNSGANQSVFGWEAGRSNSGEDQVAFGFQAGFSNVGNFQFAFGFQAGHSNTGAYQFAFGYRSGFGNTGNNVISLGYQAGRANSGHNSIFIGHNAGLNNNLDNQFIVRHEAVNSTPLIQGNFATGAIGMHGPLTVDGKIKSTEVEVRLDVWPDFVFTKDYELLTLSEVEQFISENKHLPGVPNESNVLENGLNVGEISALLLQKVEELTLYIIEINKQNQDLKRRIVEIESKNY